MVRRNMAPSLPAAPTSAAAMDSFRGLEMLATPLPTSRAATNTIGEMPSTDAASSCNGANKTIAAKP